MAKIIILKTSDNEQLLPATSSSYVICDNNETLSYNLSYLQTEIDNINISWWEEYTPES